MALFMCGLLNASSIAFAATEVPSERIIAPDDDPANTKTDPSDESDEDSPSKIPVDALPTIESDTAKPETDENPPAQDTRENMPPPTVMRDISKLPEPVRRMRELILETAKKGDVEKLRSLIGLGETATTLSIGGLEGDPIKYLKEASGDNEGFEILAILIEVLEAGYVHVDEGEDDELYIWPYFFAWPLEKLTPEMKVELFRILTAGDVEDSQNFGGYVFYRVGIKPNGQWSFFVAGD